MLTHYHNPMVREAITAVLPVFLRSFFDAIRRSGKPSTSPLLQLQDLLRRGFLVRTGTAHHLSGGFEGIKACIGAVVVIFQRWAENRKAVHLGQGGIQREPGRAAAHRVTGFHILLDAGIGGCKIKQMDPRPLGEVACGLSIVVIGRVDPETLRFEGVTPLTLDGEVGMVPRGVAFLGDVSEEGPKLLARWRDVDIRYAEGVVATAGHAEVRRRAIVALVDGVHDDVFEVAIADLAVAGAAFEADAFAALVEQRDTWRIAASPSEVAVSGQ